MDVLSTIAEVRAARAGAGPLGLVPTMGFLHEGHLSLVRRARRECGAAAVSIFVNPTQFAAGGDFDRYPRALERDLAVLSGEGVRLVFVPDAQEMYPAGFDAEVRIGGVSEGLEGAARPGHFVGVATVVAKLFNIIQPDRAYFGQKDAQQAAVVKKLVRDLDMPLQIVVAPTVRESDGLAMSSRNSYLGPDDRRSAAALYRALLTAQSRLAAGERRAEGLRQAMAGVLAAESRVVCDYVSVADPHTLKELESVGAAGALFSLAAYVGPARLIDNLVVDAQGLLSHGGL